MGLPDRLQNFDWDVAMLVGLRESMPSPGGVGAQCLFGHQELEL